MFRLVHMLLLTCAIVLAFQQQTGPVDLEREKEVYAIYSLMLTNPSTSHGADDNERYLIAPTTVPAQPETPCVRPPKDHEAAFREVLADYGRRQALPRQLKPMLSIPKPYMLLTADEVMAFMDERSLHRPGQQPASAQFRGVTDIFMLSDVYFNPRRTLALTAIASFCGSLCGLRQWKVFEKLHTGKWEELRWGACSVIAKDNGLKTKPSE